jgi:hypothetical protein
MPTHQEMSTRVSLGAVATETLPLPRRPTWDYPHLRICNRLDGILPMGHEWIAGLPPDIRPLRLAMNYPRLVNLIAVEWNNPPVASTLLTDLLNEVRGDRGGFPAAVFAELRHCTIITSTGSPNE